ncbi:MAG: sulfatase [Verrucomicrobiales bacterium]|jgi:arylsulfatase A|nr:sulfatase [Verrucomicrobiales bacterium]MBP9224146.1 sulfatase [Verrucomicrobiales bacterium]HQZ28706.1 sulfatase [Verrucomicrobiales bacterium]
MRRLIFLLTLVLVSVTCRAESANRPPNFIIIFCDNLGYGDIEPFGSTLHRTPNLNRMAEEGRKFTHFCVTAGVCTPSRASIMTGCYAQRVGMHLNPRDYHVLRPISPYGLNPDEVTIAEALQQVGYATAMVGKWHLGDQAPFLPTRQGFDYFFGIPYSDDMTERVWEKDGSHWPPLPLMVNETVIEAPVDRNGLTQRYTEEALKWIEEKKDKPFFLYLPQAMPGSTSEPFSGDAFRGKSKNGSWGDSVEELDWSTGEIMKKLESLGIAENTLIVWTSDNGAPIQKDLTDLSRGSNLPLSGRGYTTSEGAFRVPTLMWWPGTVPAATVCDELTSTMDLYPTFVRMAGGERDGVTRDGLDITDLILGKEGATSPHEVYAYYYTDQLQAVRSGPWKLFLPLQDFEQHPYFTKRGEGNSPLLFNVVEDIACSTDVAADHPDVVARLTTLAEEVRADLGDKGTPGAGMRAPGMVKVPVPVLMSTKP